jgi:predicted Zn-dependent protease
MRRTALRLLLAVPFLTVVACATSPLGRRQLKLYSDEDMAQMGATAFTQTAQKTPVSTDGRATAYVNCVANAITEALPTQTPWEVKVFDSKEVNAFALPGGKIGVYTGLLKVTQNQDQLAAVIGHEVSHVLAGHSNERVSQQAATSAGLQVASLVLGDGGIASEAAMSGLGLGAQYGILLPFSRAHESEADLLGLDLMSKAGFDPRQAVGLWQNMAKQGGDKPPEFASTHPADATRIQQIEARLPTDLPIYEQARSAGRHPRCGTDPA